VLWLRSDLGVTTGATFTWADQSGIGNNVVQATAINQPTLSATGGPRSLPAIVYAGGTQNLVSTNTITASTNVTIFAVFKVTSTAATQCLMDYGVANTNGLALFVDLLSTHERAINVAGVANESDATNSASTNFEVWTIQQTNTGPSTTLRVNGSSRPLSGNATMVAGGAGLVVGAQTSAGSSSMTGSWCELIMCSSLLPLGQVIQLEAYLRNRYGLW
jgi:hypothetical protein